MSFFLGLDLGTSSIKAIIIDKKGNPVISSSIEYPLNKPQPGWAEQDPKVWWESVIQVLDGMKNKTEINFSDIKSIGVTGQMHGLVALDDKDELIYPCITWADRRSTAQVKKIKDILSSEELEVLGNPVVNGFTAPKLLWLINQKGYDEINKILLPKDFITFKMTGKKQSDYSDASATLLFDVKKRKWATEIIEKLNIPISILPSLKPPGSIIGHLKSDVAEILNLNKGIPIIAAGGDAPLSALSNGITKSGDASITIGTGGQILTVLDDYKFDDEFRLHTLSHSLPQKWYTMGAISSAGYCLKWWRNNFARSEVKNKKKITFEFMSSKAETVPPVAEGLIFLPYLNGERSPHLDPYARGSIFGFTGKHTEAHVIRAIMEGVCFAVKENIEIMEDMGIEINELRMTGGAVKSRLWREIFATVLNRPILFAKNQRGSAFGAALSAANSYGIYANLEEAFQSIDNNWKRTDPVKENRDKYKKAFSLYKQIYRKTKVIYPELSKL